MVEETPKRRGRPPRKIVDTATDQLEQAKPVVVAAAPAVPADERIGEKVDPRAKFISADGREYRVEDGVIVERVR